MAVHLLVLIITVHRLGLNDNNDKLIWQWRQITIDTLCSYCRHVKHKHTTSQIHERLVISATMENRTETRSNWMLPNNKLQQQKLLREFKRHYHLQTCAVPMMSFENGSRWLLEFQSGGAAEQTLTALVMSVSLRSHDLSKQTVASAHIHSHRNLSTAETTKSLHITPSFPQPLHIKSAPSNVRLCL